MSRIRSGALTLALVATAGPAWALDPGGARYASPADELFWFLQVSDLHIGADLGYGSQDEDNLNWTLLDAWTVVDPEFVVATGDLVDATNGLFVPTMQYQSEWDQYRGIVDGAGMDGNIYHDVVGNHDVYSDAGATYYLANSLSGSTLGALHESWTADFSFGSYLFVGLSSVDTSGAFPGLDQPSITSEEMDFFEQSLADNPQARLAFTFTHHPMSDVGSSGDVFRGVLDALGVSLWANGHVHTLDVAYVDQTLQFNLDSSGKGSSNNLGLFAVDHDGLSARPADIGAWPLVLITSPLDAGLGGSNPWVYPVSVNAQDNFVRALVFDPDGATVVVFSVDGGGELPMTQVDGPVWQGVWDSQGLSEGSHIVNVRAVSPSGESQHSISVALSVTECDDGLDNDGNGYSDFPDDGGCDSASDPTEEGWEPPTPTPTPTPQGDDDSAPSTSAEGCGCRSGSASRGSSMALALLLLIVVRKKSQGL